MQAMKYSAILLQDYRNIVTTISSDLLLPMKQDDITFIGHPANESKFVNKIIEETQRMLPIPLNKLIHLVMNISML